MEVNSVFFRITLTPVEIPVLDHEPGAPSNVCRFTN